MGSSASRVASSDTNTVDLTEPVRSPHRRRRYIPANSLPSQSRRARRHTTSPTRGPNGKNRSEEEQDAGVESARVKRRRVEETTASTSADISMTRPSPPTESLPTLFETLPDPIASTSTEDQNAAPSTQSPPVIPLTWSDPLLDERLNTLETLSSYYTPDTVASLPGVAPLLDQAQAQRHHVDPSLAADLAARRARRPPRATFAQEPRPVGVDSDELTQRLDRVAQGRLSHVGNRLLAHLEGRQHFNSTTTEPVPVGRRAMPPPSIPPVQERAPLVMHSLINVPGPSRPSSVASEPEVQSQPQTSTMSSLRALKETLFPSTASAPPAETRPSSPSPSESDDGMISLEQATVVADMTSFGALATTAAFIGTQLLASNAISDMPSTRTRLPVATRDIVRRLVDELSTRLRSGTAVPPNIFEEALSHAMADAGGAYCSAADAHRRRAAARVAAGLPPSRSLGSPLSPPSPPVSPIAGPSTAPATYPTSPPDTYDDFLAAVHGEIISSVTAFEARQQRSRSASPEPATSEQLDIVRAYIFPQRAPDALTREGADPSVDEAANVLVSVVGLRSVSAAQSNSVMEHWRSNITSPSPRSSPEAHASTSPATAPILEETQAETEARPSIFRTLSRGWSRSQNLNSQSQSHSHIEPAQHPPSQTEVVSRRSLAEAEAAAIAPNHRTYVFWSFSGNFARNHPYLTNLDLLYDQLHRHTISEIIPILGQPKPKVATELDILSSGLEIVPGVEVEKKVENGEIVANCAERCLICYAGFEPEDECRIMRCKHMYHKGCVDTWMRDHHNTCPVCRADGVVASFPGVREAQAEVPPV